MKQSENNNTQNIFVTGFSSITSVLKQIHDETVSGNTILESIENKFDEYFSYSQLSVSGLLNNQVITNTLAFKQTSILSQINYGVLNISTMLSQALEHFGVGKKVGGNQEFTQPVTETIRETNQEGVTLNLQPMLDVLNDIKNLLFGFFRKKEYVEPETSDSPNRKDDIFENVSHLLANTLNSSILSDNMYTIFERVHLGILGTNNLLEQILDSLRSIYLYLPNLKNDGSSETSNAVKSKTSEFIKLVQSLSGFKKVLTKTFIKDFSTFLEMYEKFIDEKNTKKLIAVSFNLSSFSVVLNLVARLLGTVKSLFNGLTTSIILLTLTLVLPPFQLGFAFLIGVLKTLKLTLGGGKDSVMMVIAMRKLAMSIAMMVGAIYLIGKVPFGNVFKLIVFLGMLAGVLKLFQKKGSPIQSKNVNVNKKFGVTGIFSAAVGIALLVWSVDLASNINVSKAFGLITFIFGLATTLWIFNRRKIGKSGPLDSLMGISVGLSILLLVVDAVGEVNWAGAGLILGFIVAIGAAIALANKLMGDSKGGKFKVGLGVNVGMKGMFGFALGVAILILTIDATNELDWVGAFKLLGFIGLLGFVVSAPQLLSKGKMNGKPMGGMLGFAVGLAIIILAIDAAREVQFGPAFTMLGVMAGIVGVMFLMKRLIGTPKLVSIQIGLFSAAIIAMSGALWVLQQVKLDLSQLMVSFTAILGFIGVLWIISKVSKQITIATGIMPMIVLSMASMTGVVWLLSKTNVSLEQVGMFLLSAAAIVGLSWIVGKIGISLVYGAGILFAVSLSGLLAAQAVKKIGEANVSFVQIGMFVLTVGLVTAMCFGLSFIGIPLMIGAGILLALGLSLLITAAGLNMIANMQISVEGIGAFVESVKMIAIGYASVLPQLAIGIVAGGLAMILGIETIVVAGALYLVSEMKINVDNVKLYGTAINKLSDAYNSLGLVSLGKSVLKSLMLIPLSVATLITATAIRGISAMEIRQGSMETFGNVLKDFLHYTTEAINESLDSIKAVEPGLNALAKLVSVAGNLVDVVQAYADMKIGVWKYNTSTGKMEIVEYKKIDDAMLKSVGKGIGTLLQALIEPLSVISGDGDEWDFGNGVKVKNPFKGGWFGTDKNSGAKRIEKIGGAFSSLVGVLKGMSDNQLLTGSVSDYNKFNLIFTNWINLMIRSINTLQKVETKGLESRGEKISKFFNSLNTITNADAGNKISETLHNVMNELSDNVKWQTINSNLEKTNKNIEKIVSNINKINITKATALERNLKLFTEAKTVDGINECIAQLKELIGLVVEQQEKQTEAQSQVANTLGNWFGSEDNKSTDTNKSNDKQKQLSPVEKSKQEMNELLNILSTALEGINGKLGGTLKVKVVETSGGAFLK